VKRLFQILSLILISLFVFCPSAKASHAAGAEITYVWKSDSTYIISYHLYRDCAGIPGPDSIYFCYHNDCDGYSNAFYVKKNTYIDSPRLNGGDVWLACPSNPTTCHGGTLPGYQEWWYSAIVTLPSRCDNWVFSHTEQYRNFGIQNINCDGNDLYVEATLNNRVVQNNSSPYFTVKPIPYICNNIPFTYSSGPVEKDGDSLTFESITPMTSYGDCSAPYNESYFSGYDLVHNPIACDSTFSFNNITSEMSFTPNRTGIFVLTVRANEFRNVSGTWVKIGSVMRDIQVVVLNCTTPSPSFNVIDSTTSGLTKIGETYYNCAGTPIAFCFDAKSPDTGHVLVVNHNTALLGDSVTYTHTFSDSVRGCFSWTSHVTDTGLKIFLFTVKDSTCSGPNSIPISNTFVVPVYVNPVTKIIASSKSICSGDSLRLTAVGGTGFVWHALAGGSSDTSLSCTACKSPSAQPTLTTAYTVSATNYDGCGSKDTFNLTVNPILIPSVKLTATPDSFISITATTTFTATAINGGAKPIFRWYLDGTKILGDSVNTYITHGGITDKDTITVRLHSNATCAIPDTATAKLSLLPKRKLVVNNVAGEDRNIQLYPNPNGGDFTVSAFMPDVSASATIEIIDISGRTVYKEIAAVSNGKISKQVSLKKNVLAGQYTLHIQSGTVSKNISFTLLK